jgi:integrase
MAHYAKPFFRASRNRWYLQLGRQINLGPDKEAAFRRYHQLMAEQGTRSKCPTNPDQITAAEILDLFQQWCHTHRARATFKWYTERLQSFAESIREDLKVADLRAFHVQQWIDAHPAWKGYRRGAITAVQRAFNWATKLGHISSSPVRHLEKPPQGRREQVVSTEEFTRILECVQDQAFRDLLITAWDTGCRPQEIRCVEVRHFDASKRRWAFPPAEAKGRRRWRIVYLTDRALEISQRLAAKASDGPIFRNTDGRPWSAYAINCRWSRIQRKLGVRYCLYAFRHSLATRALQNGVDAITTANLLGHVDLTMLKRVYEHVDQNAAHMHQAAKRAAGT